MTIVIAAWVACAFAMPALSGMPASNDAAAPKLRIPAGARPTRYAVTLAIVPGAASVAGEITIDIALDRPHPVLWLNAVAVSVSKMTLDAADSEARIITDNDQFVGLAFDPPLSAGSHRLTLTFVAEQNRNSTRGIFTLQEGGARYTMTQFEHSGMRARGVMPAPNASSRRRSNRSTTARRCAPVRRAASTPFSLNTDSRFNASRGPFRPCAS